VASVPSRSAPPIQNVCHSGCRSRRAWTRNCNVATTSSRVSEIMARIAAAAIRHGVHHSADGDRLQDDESDADDAERHDEDAEKRNHPGHRLPPRLVAHERHQELDHLGDRAQAGVGDRKGTGHVGGQYTLGAEAEERIGKRRDVVQLERGHLPREKEPDEPLRVHAGGGPPGSHGMYIQNCGVVLNSCASVSAVSAVTPRLPPPRPASSRAAPGTPRAGSPRGEWPVPDWRHRAGCSQWWQLPYAAPPSHRAASASRLSLVQSRCPETCADASRCTSTHPWPLPISA